MSGGQCVTGPDRDAISQILARYCWAFDAGDGDAYAALWTEDGVLSGFGAPSVGHAALKQAVAQSFEQLGGKTRHHLHNVVMAYAGLGDEVRVEGYNLVTNWAEMPSLFAMVESRFVLRREGETWKIAQVDLQFVQ
jgi:uncharacterized protein (TIGR02246 family)